ncbi:hypothetical protein E8E12_003191 [Didymella heteroderae]|uniref:Uncharacterized protein n=1 Tax=Didymella heteroderae TaxID=1769908 RepID=A0A9P5C2C3_9PLEO|nr:hypothetical protein E8E12_003191 [Didymella heteroderae]
MSQNPDAVANQGFFAGHVKPSEPLMTGGHQPGRIVSEADAAPEFRAKTLPAGTAPKSSTYTPNPDLHNQRMFTSASSTLVGADSGSVHTGLGHPVWGQTSQELHDNSKHSGGSGGLAGLKEHYEQGNVRDLKDDPKHAKQRNLEEPAAGTRGNTGGPPAEEREPEQIS